MRFREFDMERMQSTWEFQVEYDMSESGIRPLTLREVVSLGFDLEAFLDGPYGYSQSNGTTELRAALASIYPGSDVNSIEVTNGTSEANFLVALCTLSPGKRLALQTPNYLQLCGVAPGLGAEVSTFKMDPQNDWEPDWEEFEKAVTPQTGLVYLSNPHNPTGSILTDQSMRRIVARCEEVGAWLLADEVYQGAEVNGRRTPSFWGMSDRVIVTSGLSKAYGIPGVRIGWIVGPKSLIAKCWSQHDYLTIGPNKLSDRIAQIVVQPENRESCYQRTRAVLRHNLPIMRRWVESFEGFLEWREPEAGAFGLVRYNAPIEARVIADRLRQERSTLVVPGAMLGIDQYLRIWLGGEEGYVREGLRRIGLEIERMRDSVS